MWGARILERLCHCIGLCGRKADVCIHWFTNQVWGCFSGNSCSSNQTKGTQGTLVKQWRKFLWSHADCDIRCTVPYSKRGASWNAEPSRWNSIYWIDVLGCSTNLNTKWAAGGGDSGSDRSILLLPEWLTTALLYTWDFLEVTMSHWWLIFSHPPQLSFPGPLNMLTLKHLWLAICRSGHTTFVSIQRPCLSSEPACVYSCLYPTQS